MTLQQKITDGIHTMKEKFDGMRKKLTVGGVLQTTALVITGTMLVGCDEEPLRDNIPENEAMTKSIKAKTIMTDAIMDDGILRDTCVIGGETYAIAEESVSMHEYGHETKFSLRKPTDNVANYFVTLKSYGGSASEVQQIYTIQIFDQGGNDLTKKPDGDVVKKAFLSSGQRALGWKKKEDTEGGNSSALTEMINGITINPSTTVSTIVSFCDTIFRSGETVGVGDKKYQNLKKSLSLGEQRNSNLDNILRTEACRTNLRNHIRETYQITPDILMNYAANSEMIGNHRLWGEKGKAAKLIIYLQLLCNSYGISTHYNEDGLGVNSLGIDGVDKHATRQAMNHLVAMLNMEKRITLLTSQKDQGVDTETMKNITTVLSEHIRRHFNIKEPTISWDQGVMKLGLPNDRQITLEPTTDGLKVHCLNKKFPHIQNIRSIHPLFAWKEIADSGLFAEEHASTLSDFFATANLMIDLHTKLESNKEDIPRNGFSFDGNELRLDDTTWGQVWKTDTSREIYQTMFVKMDEQQKTMIISILNSMIDVYRVKM